MCGAIAAADPNTQGLISSSKTGSSGSGSAEAPCGDCWWTYFRYHRQSQEIAHETHHGYKDLSAVTLPQDGWK